MSLNRCFLHGYICNIPELRQTKSGKNVCSFTLAVKRDSSSDQTDFITCVAWRQTAEFVSRYFIKGQMIAVEGTLRSGSYQDRQHPDVTHYKTEVYVDNVEFCGSKEQKGSTGRASAPQPAQQAVQAAQAAGVQTQPAYSSASEWEEILSDGDVPF